MNFDAYIGFFNKITEEGIFENRIRIKYIYDDKIIPKKNIIKKKIETTKILVNLHIEDNKILLIEDYPINFLISQSILIGNRCNLYEFTFKNDIKNKIYITEKEILKKLINRVKENSIKRVNLNNLENQRYFIEYEQPEIIKNLKKYIYETRNLDMNAIHIIDQGKKIENFIPNIKERHLRYANYMKIPTTKIFKNNYIIDTNIHVNNTIDHIKRVQPKFKIKLKTLWKYNEKNQKLHKDLVDEYSLNITNTKYNIIQTIADCEVTNFNKEELIKRLYGINKIILSTLTGKYEIPIWKAHKKGEIIPIKDTIEFKKLTGLEFKPEGLENIYLMSQEGEKGLYKKLYINDRLEECFETLDDKEIIYFEKISELLIKLIYNKSPKKIIYLDNINPMAKKEITILTRRVLNKTIKEIIKTTKYPKNPSNEKTLFNTYLKYVNTKLQNNLEKFKHYPSKPLLFTNTIDELRVLNKSFNHLKINEEDLYLLNQTVYLIINILDEFNKDEAKTLATRFYEYYKIKEKPKKYLIDPKIEKIIRDLIITNTIASKEKIYIYLKRKDGIITKNINKNILELKEEPNHEKLIRIKKSYLKKIFPNRHKEIINKLSNINTHKDIENAKNKIIEIKNRQIKIKKEFFTEENDYGKYRIIKNNELFISLRNKNN